MSLVEFEETRIEPRLKYDETPKILGWAIKYSGGLIKNETQASIFWVVFASLVIVISIILLVGDGGNSAKDLPVFPAEF